MMAEHELILLPGLLCDEKLWHHQVQALSDICNISVADLTREDNIPDMARAVLRRAPERFALAGLSMGGYVAQEIMRQEPERVERLALVNTNARTDTPEQIARRKSMMDLADHGKFKGVTPMLLPSFLHPDHVEKEGIGDVVLQMAEHTGKDAFLRHQNAIMHRKDGREDLKKINCPVLILCGEQDTLTPPKVHEEMVDAIGDNATFVVVEHAGHLAPLEQPNLVSAAFRKWLTE
ncbi:MAG: alpha/beta fold hydrolase [Rhodospirillaceae bacterium]|nr:alpha/beta fold hydrolase [Rhodospirillaceae bacterium]